VRQINDLKEKCRKPHCPAVPQSGPDAGNHHKSDY
jgi:hypothetical protein